MSVADVLRELKGAADPLKAAFFPRFFKTDKGQYGEGDVFLGVTVPKQRTVAKAHRTLPLPEIAKLLQSPVHEPRLTGLLILISQYRSAETHAKKAIVDFYLDHLDGVNNWDLVDLSAPSLLGDWLLTEKSSAIFDRFAHSQNLWKQRISIVATFAFIRAGRFDETLRIAEILLHHKHDLIHKATGWMLREVGKRDQKTLLKFLDAHAAEMPRTMLRYSIERLPISMRKRMLDVRLLPLRT